MDIHYLFCNVCHRRIMAPAFLEKAKVQGKIILGCGHCKKGKVEISPKNKENDAASPNG